MPAAQIKINAYVKLIIAYFIFNAYIYKSNLNCDFILILIYLAMYMYVYGHIFFKLC